MKKASYSRLILLLTVIALFAAIALTFTACGDTGAKSDAGADSSVGSSQEALITISVDVVDDKGETTTYSIETAETTLYGALTQEELIEGEDGDYGYYIKAVNGLTADYNVDQSYWALYKGDEYLMTGVSETPIADGETYSLVYTKE